jgi:plasmid replication initiation protein
MDEDRAYAEFEITSGRSVDSIEFDFSFTEDDIFGETRSVVTRRDAERQRMARVFSKSIAGNSADELKEFLKKRGATNYLGG